MPMWPDAKKKCLVNWTMLINGNPNADDYWNW